MPCFNITIVKFRTVFFFRIRNVPTKNMHGNLILPNLFRMMLAGDPKISYVFVLPICTGTIILAHL